MKIAEREVLASGLLDHRRLGSLYVGRNRAEAVAFRLAGFRQEKDQGQGSDKRNQHDELPPPAHADVVQATGGNREARNKGSQGVDGLEKAELHRKTQHHVDDDKPDQDQHLEERKHPVLGTAGPALEVGVVLQTVDIPVHLFTF